MRWTEGLHEKRAGQFSSLKTFNDYNLLLLT